MSAAVTTRRYRAGGSGGLDTAADARYPFASRGALPVWSVLNGRYIREEDSYERNEFVARAQRAAGIIDAVRRGRYALLIHHSLTVRSEGEEWQMDFSSEISGLTEALELLGVDTVRD